MTALKKETCKDKIKDSFQNLLDDWFLASLFCGEKEENISEYGHDKGAGDYLEYESLYDYVNQTALSFDFVEGNSFSIKLNKSKAVHSKAGYYRLQLSWGGPSTEFRVYTDKDLNISYIEYWYLDWYDGASIIVTDSIVIDLIRQFLEIESYE